MKKWFTDVYNLCHDMGATGVVFEAIGRHGRVSGRVGDASFIVYTSLTPSDGNAIKQVARSIERQLRQPYVPHCDRRKQTLLYNKRC